MTTLALPAASTAKVTAALVLLCNLDAAFIVVNPDGSATGDLLDVEFHDRTGECIEWLTASDMPEASNDHYAAWEDLESARRAGLTDGVRYTILPA